MLVRPDLPACGIAGLKAAALAVSRTSSDRRVSVHEDVDYVIQSIITA